MTAPRLFTLQRDRDISGVSGTGTVADGVLWPDGSASVRWRGDRPSTVAWGNFADVEHIHGHNGATRIVWTDEEEPRRCPYHPDAFGYEHTDCGFHWHGRDPMDIPMRDGEPICPRCELARLTEENKRS